MAKLTRRSHDDAHGLRSNLTDAERRLWHLVRDRRLDGWKFRRQHPIPPWTADFARVEAQLVVEADGGQHDGGADGARDRDLAARGWRVLRFWNDEILKEPEGVALTILRALRGVNGNEEVPSPPPSPVAPAMGEGGGEGLLISGPSE